ncbi:HU family DNA-binding protein, partial [Escherichia coli]|nr:integration host factor subunit alpha [Escherichia coli]
MTRAEIFDAIYAVCPNLTRGQARAVFEMMLEEVGDAFVRGESVRLRSFG